MHPVSPQAPAYRSLADRIGMLASSLCVLHCVLLPGAVLFLPFLTLGSTADAWLEGGTLLCSALAGWVALGRGYRHHRQQAVVVLFIAGFLLCLLAGLSRHEGVEIGGKAVGALLLLLAHRRNTRLARRTTPHSHQLKSV